MTQSILAFLQAFPLLVKTINELVNELRGMREIQQANYVIKLKDELSVHIDAISKAKNNDEIRKALASLYPLINK